MDLKTNRIIISRNVCFNEFIFHAATSKGTAATYHFLGADDEPSALFRTFFKVRMSIKILLLLCQTQFHLQLQHPLLLHKRLRVWRSQPLLLATRCKLEVKLV